MPKVELPPDFYPPKQFQLLDLKFEALQPVHNEVDYQAWTSCRESLKGIFGLRNPWPDDVGSLEKNKKDLEKHWREFQTREAFTYTILNSEKSLCVGCVYVRPTPLKDFQARVDFWLVDEYRHLSDSFFNGFRLLLNGEWGLDKVVFPGRSMSWDEYYQQLDEARVESR